MNAPQTKPAASPADDTQKVIALKTAQTPTTLAAEEADTAKEVVLDDRKPRRWGWLLLILGMGGLGLWAGYAPLDQGIAAPGQVVVTGNRKAVQPMASGLVSALLVKEGDQVKAGQVVLRLDDTQARSQLEVARGQLLSLQATEARLNAERVGAQAISWPASFNASSDRRAAEAVALNQQLFRSRRETQQGELAAMNESLGGLQAQLEGLEASRRNKDEQLRF